MAEEFECDADTIKNFTDGACEFAKQYCDHESLFNFYSLHYCQFDDHSYITIPLYLLLIIL